MLDRFQRLACLARKTSPAKLFSIQWFLRLFWAIFIKWDELSGLPPEPLKRSEKHNNQFVFHLNNFLRNFCSKQRLLSHSLMPPTPLQLGPTCSLVHGGCWQDARLLSPSSLHTMGTESSQVKVFLPAFVYRKSFCCWCCSLFPILSRVSFNVALLYYYLNKQYWFCQIHQVAGWKVGEQGKSGREWGL